MTMKPQSEHEIQRDFFIWVRYTAVFGFSSNAAALNEYKKTLNRYEELIHNLVIDSKEPTLNLMHAIPNGGLRNKTTARKLKYEGVISGVPDVFLPIARGGFHGLYIEFKTLNRRNHKNGGLTDSQFSFMQNVKDQGYNTAVAYSLDSAIQIVKDYYNKN